MKKKILIFFMIVSIIVIYTNAYADTLYQQKQSVEADIENTKEAIENISNEKGEIMEEVNKLNGTILETESEISDLKNKIENLDESIEFKSKDLEDKQKLLDERLSAVYMSSGNTYLEAFFNGGIINFVSNYEIIKQIAEYDNNLIEEVKKEKSDLHSSKIALENSKIEIQVKQNQLETQKSEKISKIESLTEEQKSMQAAIEEKQQELARINEAVIRATEEAQASYGGNGEGDIIEGEAAAASSGGMTWPTRIEHRVNSLYAPNGRTDTSGYVGTPHKGLDIYAPSGTPIYAAKDGTVVYVNYSGYGGGWGLYVVIYHGDDENGKPIYTRYAHASAIASGIQVGTQVTTSTVIMYAGNTGASEGAHLHFEVCLGDMYSQINPCTFLGITNTKGNHD
ncbi:MAG: peptidoglycan DD-metalloendopeptidase family protein [Clostridia bacterium]|nr:peptidoglycan DD-metalloendopeptidase family protein [Clostridia bacterium]